MRRTATKAAGRQSPPGWQSGNRRGCGRMWRLSRNSNELHGVVVAALPEVLALTVQQKKEVQPAPTCDIASVTGRFRRPPFSLAY